jgi:3-oxoacyl-[acyl-carrier-protein] synthase II
VAQATKDKAGRPIIAVTGMGLITSLGTGREDNWTKLVAGQSGIRRISRFPTDGLRTTIAGTVDHEYEEGMAPSVMTEKIARIVGEEAIAQAVGWEAGDAANA